MSKTFQPVQLERSDWEEIASCLDLKRMGLMRGDYRPCLEHGPKCRACDMAWIEQIDRILDAIGPDGETAIENGVCPCS